ncbi:hypothetical protein PPL_11455 [Heterostelium album PN500]|uniref:Tudor domain-containing protein n=1 Tax=Heterostelium pallidum (strain ATCC 26659 / Pp 5 / PN500) TaxID=670386 RepID=D3BTG1_HETP5|nr:hypothetical protein PPL_11455 [Heterostelium album PN500]EFA75378.1 hypothetical protein PPL_11455 [Heterostelium album PN500]|eukprot:XP_020427512.1 hypothetical protein PPL_11455 [Heterostelium album PN500]
MLQTKPIKSSFLSRSNNLNSIFEESKFHFFYSQTITPKSPIKHKSPSKIKTTPTKDINNIPNINVTSKSPFKIKSPLQSNVSPLNNTTPKNESTDQLVKDVKSHDAPSLITNNNNIATFQYPITPQKQQKEKLILKIKIKSASIEQSTSTTTTTTNPHVTTRRTQRVLTTPIKQKNNQQKKTQPKKKLFIPPSPTSPGYKNLPSVDSFDIINYKITNSTPTIGSYVECKTYLEKYEDTWHKARLMEFSNGMAKVRYLDYKYEFLPLSRIKPLCVERDNEEWVPGTKCMVFLNYLHFEAVIQAKADHDKCYLVKLVDTETKNIEINQKYIFQYFTY